MYSVQGKIGYSSPQTSAMSDGHSTVPGMNVPAEGSLVLSTDVKPRLKWTLDLHERFIEAVDQLGGADKATPKAIMKLMSVPGLTLYHLKSHLQKYRLSKNLHKQANDSNTNNGTTANITAEGKAIANDSDDESSNIRSREIRQAVQMQTEVQRRLHEQLEVQRHLQLRIEAQGKYLQSVLEKAQETLGREKLGSAGLEVAKIQLSELVSRVSTDCLGSAFSELKSMTHLGLKKTLVNQTTACSMGSCLTSWEGSQKEKETYTIDNSFLYPKQDSSRPDQMNSAWHTDTTESTSIPSKTFPKHRNISNLATQGQKERRNESTLHGVKQKEKDGKEDSCEQPKNRRHATLLESQKPVQRFKFEDRTMQLDLNVQDEDDAASSSRQFDLNGFSWN